MLRDQAHLGLGPEAAGIGPADDLGLHRQPRLRGRRVADRPAGHHPLGLVEPALGAGPTVITDVEARFVDDGDLITSAGVSAGIDMALHLVARLANVERAREVRRDIQYSPDAPDLSLSPRPKENP